MRRWLPALALAGVTTMLLAGCAPARGADGDLTDDWPALRVPKPFAPAADTGLPRIYLVVQASTYETVDCARSHLAETIHVGTFVGPDALTETRPGPGRRRCAPPAPSATSGPGRCSAATGTPPGWRCRSRCRPHPPGPRRALVPLRPQRDRQHRQHPPARPHRQPARRADRRQPADHRSFDPKLIGDNLNYMAPALCTKPHRAEFVGVYQERDMSRADLQEVPARRRRTRRCMQ